VTGDSLAYMKSEVLMDFPGIASEVFQFLTELGFRCVERDSTRVRYESNVVFIDVYKGRLSSVVNVDYGLLKDPDAGHDILQLLDYLKVTSSINYWHLRPTANAIDLETRLRELAELLKRYGRPILENDESFIRAIHRAEVEKSMVQFRDNSQEQAILWARRYWKEKEYYRVVFFLKPYERSLPPEWQAVYAESISKLDTTERGADTWK
jgi:hypothetical protein